MNYSVVGIQQLQSVTAENPAVQQERGTLEERALNALRDWVRMNPVERAMSFELDRAAMELLAFEIRHGLV